MISTFRNGTLGVVGIIATRSELCHMSYSDGDGLGLILNAVNDPRCWRSAGCVYLKA